MSKFLLILTLLFIGCATTSEVAPGPTTEVYSDVMCVNNVTYIIAIINRDSDIKGVGLSVMFDAAGNPLVCDMEK